MRIVAKTEPATTVQLMLHRMRRADEFADLATRRSAPTPMPLAGLQDGPRETTPLSIIAAPHAGRWSAKWPLLRVGRPLPPSRCRPHTQHPRRTGTAPRRSRSACFARRAPRARARSSASPHRATALARSGTCEHRIKRIAGALQSDAEECNLASHCFQKAFAELGPSRVPEKLDQNRCDADGTAMIHEPMKYQSMAHPGSWASNLSSAARSAEMSGGAYNSCRAALRTPSLQRTPKANVQETIRCDLVRE